VVIAGAVTAGSMISVAQASPELPAKTPAQLLAAVAGHSGPPPALTGTVVETASLGIPQLPGSGDPMSITSLLSGSHTIKVWYGNPAHLRLAVPVQMGETDLIRNGTSAWVWQSNANSVTHITLPAKSTSAGSAPQLPQTPLTPQQAAKQALAAAGPSTTVSVDRNVSVAGQAAYQLVLAPKDGRSLIGRVSIALDAAKNVPLRVQVFAKGAKAPAFQVGYTSISFVKPAAANFTFKAPAGAKIQQATLPGSMPNGWTGQSPAQAKQASKQFQVIGKDWTSVAVLPASALSALSGSGSAASAAGHAAQSAAGNSAYSSSGSGDSAALAAGLLKAATPVHGTWGSGRLLHTSLISMLITDNGHVLVGAVTPSVLYSAAAHVK
jgi:outer membrane lipoprotein-sorting protein